MLSPSLSVLAWSLIAQSVYQRTFSVPEILFQRPGVRILHTVEEDKLSPFDSKIVCLCQSTRALKLTTTNMYVFMYACMHVCIYVCTYVCMHACLLACYLPKFEFWKYVRLIVCLFVCLSWYKTTHNSWRFVISSPNFTHICILACYKS